MKKSILLVTFLLFTASLAYSTTRTVTVQNFSFNPSTLNANVGDTIKWQWIEGRHTTTCDGTNGTSKPVGAASWDATLQASGDTYMYKITVPGSYIYNCTFHAPSMAGSITVTPSAVINLSDVVPDKFSLKQNYPNPFNPETKINFQLASSGNVKLTVYDLSGKMVTSLVDQRLSPGTYSVSFNGAGLSSGMYFYKLETDLYSEIKRMMLVK